MKEFVFNISGYAVMRAETIEQARSELLDEQLFNTNVDIELESEEEIEEWYPNVLGVIDQ